MASKEQRLLARMGSVLLTGIAFFALAKYETEQLHEDVLPDVTYTFQPMEQKTADTTQPVVYADTVMTGTPALPTVMRFPDPHAKSDRNRAAFFQTYNKENATYLCDHTILKAFHAQTILFTNQMTGLIIERGLESDKTPAGIDTAFSVESFRNTRIATSIRDTPEAPVSEHDDIELRNITIVDAQQDTLRLTQIRDAITSRYFAEFMLMKKGHAAGDIQKQTYVDLNAVEFSEVTAPASIAIKNNKLIEAAKLMRANAIEHVDLPPREPIRLPGEKPLYLLS